MSRPRSLSEVLEPNNDTWRASQNIIGTGEREQATFRPQVAEQQAIWSIGNETIISDGVKRPIGFERNILRNLNNVVKVEQSNISSNVNKKYYRPKKGSGRQSLRVPECGFCKNNGHDFNHILKDNLGRMACPRLRKYICPKCHETGDNAHTIKYCPIIENVEPLFQHYQKY